MLASQIKRVVETEDPKKAIFEALEPFLGGMRPTGGDVIVCVYERGEKTRGGIIIPETASRRAEDSIQGCVGVIVKIGPNFSKHFPFLGIDPPPKVGDWVMFRNQDCISFLMGEGDRTRSMRQMQGDMIRSVISDPQSVL